MSPSVRNDWLPALAIGALTILAYAASLSGGFVWDDALYLRDNPLIKAPDGLRRIWATTEFTDYYALSNSSFWLEWRLWGAHPFGYRLVNLLLHAGNALLLWRLLHRLRLPGAWLAGAIFALHPLNVMSVAWISERKNCLSLLFVLLAVIAFVRWDDERRRGWYVAALSCFVLALLSKSAVVMLPVVLLLLLWWRHGEFHRSWIPATVPFFVLSLVMGLVTIWFEQQHGIKAEVVRTDGFLARLAGAGWAVWFYGGKILLPVNLCVIYPRWETDPSNLWHWVPLAGLVIGLVLLWRYRQRWGRGALCAVGCFVAMLFPVLGFFNIAFMAYSFVADHWVYSALPALLALVGTLRWRWIFWLVVPVFLVLTWQRMPVWQNELALWDDTVRRNPSAWMAHNNLGNALLPTGQREAAARHYRATIELRPGYANAHFNLGIAYAQTGRSADALTEFQAAARLKPGMAEAHNNIGALLVQAGRTNEAIPEFQEAVRCAPRWEEPRRNLKLIGAPN